MKNVFKIITQLLSSVAIYISAILIFGDRFFIGFIAGVLSLAVSLLISLKK